MNHLLSAVACVVVLTVTPTDPLLFLVFRLLFVVWFHPETEALPMMYCK